MTSPRSGLFSPTGRVRSALRALKRKRRTRSGVKLILELLNWLAWLAQVLIAGFLAYKKSKDSTEWALAICLVAAAFYASVYKVWLSGLFKPKRLETEAARRPERLSVGLTQVGSLLATGHIAGQSILDIERIALQSIRSEVQAYIGDAEGVDVNVSLLVEYSPDPTKLCCINRADLTRAVPKYYPKDEMLAWECIREGLMKHAPDLGKSSPNYRSVVCIPIQYVIGEHAYYCGAMTIDSAAAYEFWGIENRLQVICEPYVRLLAITLLLREQSSFWPWL